LEAEARNAVGQAKRAQEKHVRDLEAKISGLEEKQKELLAVLEDPAAYESGGRAVTVNRELSAVVEDLARLTREWERATATV
jgi:hypothetical protein